LWVQILPGPFLSTRELRHWFQFNFGKCRTDAGETIGPMLMLDANDTISNTEEGGETVEEEEAVGGEEVAE
jgi:hypothetical protein